MNTIESRTKIRQQQSRMYSLQTNSTLINPFSIEINTIRILSSQSTIIRHTGNVFFPILKSQTPLKSLAFDWHCPSDIFIIRRTAHICFIYNDNTL